MKKITVRLISVILLIAISVLPIMACKKDRPEYVSLTIEGYGEIIIKLDYKNAPATAKNFAKLVEDGFYNGLTFHRVIDDFMIQGGDPLGTGHGGSGKHIKGEFALNGHSNNLHHRRGVVSMARSDDYDSASSQFFICNSNSQSVTNLDGAYAAFGIVVEGMDVVDSITEITSMYAMRGGVIQDASKRAVITEAKIIDYEK